MPVQKRILTIEAQGEDAEKTFCLSGDARQPAGLDRRKDLPLCAFGVW